MTEVVAISRKAAEVKDRIERSFKNITTSYYDLCLAIYEAYENEYAKEWGYESLFHYAEHRLGMKRRSVFYLLDCAKAIHTAKLGREQVEHLGWTKFKEIAPLIAEDPKRSEALIGLAEEKSSRELIGEVKHIKGAKARPDVLRLSLRFDGESMAVVNDAMRIAYGLIGREDPSFAINHICAEWLMLRWGSEIESPLEAWVEFLERAYGVKLQVVTPVDEVEAVLAPEGEVPRIDDLLAETKDLLDEFMEVKQ